MIYVVMRRVVRVGGFGDEGITLIEIDREAECVGFGGLIDRHAGQQPAGNFQRRRAVTRTLLHARKPGRHLPHGIKSNHLS